MADPIAQIQTLIRQLQGALGGKSFRSGTAGCVFTASAVSATATVAHGLPRSPSSVTFGAFDLNVDGISLVSVDATNIVIQARYAASVTGTAFIMWHATA
jgi:hypothetical protein